VVYVFYDDRNVILPKVKRYWADIVKTLPEFASLLLTEVKLPEKHHFDHYIGCNDSKHMGIIYVWTHCVLKKFNTGRDMDFDTFASKSLDTTLANDTTSEFEILGDAYNPKDLYKKAADKTDLPQQPHDNIRIQHESFIKNKFVESTRKIEYKGRA
jgi:hypothetical protein